VKVVGLNIEKGVFSAAVVVKGMRSDELKDSFRIPYASDAELVELLKEKARDWAGARIVSSLSGLNFTQRLVHFPFSDSKRVHKALPFEIEDSLPFSLDDVVLEHLVIGNEKGKKDTGAKKETPVLGIMLPKIVLRQHLDLLASAGMDPHAIVPSFAGLNSVAKMMKTEGTVLVISGHDLCLKDQDAVLGLRSYYDPAPTAGFRHTLKALETEFNVIIEKALILSGESGVPAELAEMGIAVEQVTPGLGGKPATDAVSLGLALSEQINFRVGDFAYRLADSGIRRRRRTLAVVGVLTAFVAFMNIGVKYYVVQSGYGKLDKEIKEVFRQAVPDARSSADPVRQLKTRLDEARKKFGVLGTGTSALEVMKAVTDGIPREVRVSFTEFNLEGDRLKLQGEAATFESVDKIKAELQKAPQFSEVAVQDTRMGVDNKVKFRFEMKLKQVM